MNSFGGVWGCIGIHPGGGGRVRYGCGQAVVQVFVAAAAAFGVCDVLKFMLMVFVVVFFCVHGFSLLKVRMGFYGAGDRGVFVAFCGSCFDLRCEG